MDENAIDVTAETFPVEVIEESRRRPVIVDFWAPWCGPCRFVGPLLEKLARAAGGAWRLARLNTDEAPEMARRFRIQGVPTLLAFRDGAVVAEQVGALGERELAQWIDAVLPGPDEALATHASALVAEGRLDEAEQVLRRALDARPRSVEALLGLARIEALRGRAEVGRRWLDLVTVGDARRHAERIGRLRLELRAASEEAPPRLRKGCKDALAGRWEEGLATLLQVVRDSEGELRDQARAAMVEAFDTLGPDSEIARRYRDLLAKELFR